MAGEFCRARHEDGRYCVMADGHYGDHSYGKARAGGGIHMKPNRCPCHTCQSLTLNALDEVVPKPRQATPAETLIYERQPGETCSCARLNAREGALKYACARCPPPTPSIAEARCSAWRMEPTAEEAERRAEAARRVVMQVQASMRPSAKDATCATAKAVLGHTSCEACSPRPINATYEQADVEYVAREVAKWGVPGESIVAVWGRVSQLASAEVSRRTKAEKP